MKRLIFCMLFLAGCAHPVVLPESPKFDNVQVIDVEGGICMDNENVAILWNNLQKMKAYCDELKKELERK